MAAGQNQPQPIVLDVISVGYVRRGDVFSGYIVQRIHPCIAADAVDGFAAACGYQPRPRVLRYAVARPLLQRGTEGFMQRLLSGGEIAEQANQRCEHAA